MTQQQLTVREQRIMDKFLQLTKDKHNESFVKKCANEKYIVDDISKLEINDISADCLKYYLRYQDIVNLVSCGLHYSKEFDIDHIKSVFSKRFSKEDLIRSEYLIRDAQDNTLLNKKIESLQNILKIREDKQDSLDDIARSFLKVKSVLECIKAIDDITKLELNDDAIKYSSNYLRYQNLVHTISNVIKEYGIPIETIESLLSEKSSDKSLKRVEYLIRDAQDNTLLNEKIKALKHKRDKHNSLNTILELFLAFTSKNSSKLGKSLPFENSVDDITKLELNNDAIKYSSYYCEYQNLVNKTIKEMEGGNITIQDLQEMFNNKFSKDELSHCNYFIRDVEDNAILNQKIPELLKLKYGESGITVALLNISEKIKEMINVENQFKLRYGEEAFDSLCFSNSIPDLIKVEIWFFKRKKSSKYVIDLLKDFKIKGDRVLKHFENDPVFLAKMRIIWEDAQKDSYVNRCISKLKRYRKEEKEKQREITLEAEEKLRIEAEERIRVMNTGYDKDGNKFIHDGEGNVIEKIIDGITYFYEDDEVVKKIENGIIYIYEDGELIEKEDNEGTHYYEDGELVSKWDGNNTYIYEFGEVSEIQHRDGSTTVYDSDRSYSSYNSETGNVEYYNAENKLVRMENGKGEKVQTEDEQYVCEKKYAKFYEFVKNEFEIIEHTYKDDFHKFSFSTEDNRYFVIRFEAFSKDSPYYEIFKDEYDYYSSITISVNPDKYVKDLEPYDIYGSQDHTIEFNRNEIDDRELEEISSPSFNVEAGVGLEVKEILDNLIEDMNAAKEKYNSSIEKEDDVF